MRSSVRAIGALGVLALLAALATFVWRTGHGTASTAPNPAPSLPSVMVSPPLVQRIVEWREFAGHFEATAAIEIRARVSGHLQSIAFKDGEIVQAGQVLFVIDPRPYQTAVAEARAQLSSARAQVDLTNLELQRAEQLLGSSSVSRATYDQRRQQKLAADAAVELAQANLNRAQLDLDFTEIRAPITGRVSNRRVDMGSLVSDSGTLLTTIVAFDPIYFVFDMSERDFVAHERAVKAGELPSMRDGNVPVQLRLQDDTGWPFQGTLGFVDNRLEQGAGTIRVRATLANADFFITPGQFGRVRLPSSAAYDAIMVPETALLTDQANRIVLKLGLGDTLQTAVLELGPSRPDGLRIVRSGLRPEDRIVVDGLLRARAGQKFCRGKSRSPDVQINESRCGTPP